MELDSLRLWCDPLPRCAARQMALDQALFERTRAGDGAFARFYSWDAPAATVGYFHRFETGENPHGDEALALRPVRRFTGGGPVEHGADVTFLLTLPAGSEAARLPAPERYRWIHEGLARALRAGGVKAALAPASAPGGFSPCFLRAEQWDLVDPRDGRKIAGGAQRRSGGAVIHQGSVRLDAPWRDPAAPWVRVFLASLARRVGDFAPGERLHAEEESRRLEAERFATADWNRWG